MKKVLIIISVLAGLCSCGTTSSGPLYYWGGDKGNATIYEEMAYKDYKKQTPEALCGLICAYERIVTNPSGSRKMPPPGICAEYAYFLLQPETAATFMERATDQQKKVFGTSDYNGFFRERGEEMLQKELEYYPESRPFIEPLINKWTK